MNCKPGDLAYIVAPFHEPARGRVVLVESAVQGETMIVDGLLYSREADVRYKIAWVCSSPAGVPLDIGVVVNRLCIADECLRPINRPTDGAQDERQIWRPRTAEVAS